MRVLQINTVSGFGSTGGIVTDLAHALEKNGDECYIAYGQLTASYPHSFKIGTKLENHLHNVGSRLLGKQGYYTKRGTRALIRYIETIRPDVIHLHNLHGNYLNLKILFEYLSKAEIPVVWTLHDCWAFTGKCAHYSDVNCRKWEVHCHNCTQIRKYPPSIFFDKSERMYSDKKKWFTSIKNMKIITVSNWLAGEAKKSFLGIYQITTIYNWVDHYVFRQSESDNIRAKYGIDKEKFIILAVSAFWSTGDGKLEDVIRLSRLITTDMRIILAGRIKAGTKIPSEIIQIPYIHSRNELSQIFSMANVYVHLSIEDTFGKVIAEALSCGTPAIVYNSTACPELIRDGCGYIVEKRDVDAVFKKINTVKSEGKLKYVSKCKQHVKENFKSEVNIEKTIQLYKSKTSIC